MSGDTMMIEILSLVLCCTFKCRDSRERVLKVEQSSLIWRNMVDYRLEVHARYLPHSPYIGVPFSDNANVNSSLVAHGTA